VTCRRRNVIGDQFVGFPNFFDASEFLDTQVTFYIFGEHDEHLRQTYLQREVGYRLEDAIAVTEPALGMASLALEARLNGVLHGCYADSEIFDRSEASLVLNSTVGRSAQSKNPIHTFRSYQSIRLFRLSLPEPAPP
jgi:hypothetical protein